MDPFAAIDYEQTSAALGVPAGPAPAPAPTRSRAPRLTRRQVRKVITTVAAAHGATVTERADGFRVELAVGHVEVRARCECGFFAGGNDTTGATVTLGWALRSALKAALKSLPPAPAPAPAAPPVSVRHNGAPGPLAARVEAAIVASCPAPTPAWRGREWSIFWYTADRAAVNALGEASGFAIDNGVVSAPRGFRGDFNCPAVPPPAEIGIVRDAVAAVLAERRAA